MLLTRINYFSRNNFSIYKYIPKNFGNTFYLDMEHFINWLKKQDNHVKGDMFENFAKYYFLDKGATNVYINRKNSTNPIPESIKKSLDINKDIGVDLVVEYNKPLIPTTYDFVQVKFRNKNILNWKEISTFFGCKSVYTSMRIRKWYIFTNCESMSRNCPIVDSFKYITLENLLNNVKCDRIINNYFIYNKKNDQYNIKENYDTSIFSMSSIHSAISSISDKFTSWNK